MKVRPERRSDRAAVRVVHRCAFGDHGAVVAELVDELRELVATDEGLSLVAEHRGDVVGHVMFTRSLLDAPRRLIDVQVLSPVGAARTSATGGRVGADPCGPEVMIQRRVPVVFLEGDPGYYSRFGFQAGGPRGFRKPSLRIPDAAFQAEFADGLVLRIAAIARSSFVAAAEPSRGLPLLPAAGPEEKSRQDRTGRPCGVSSSSMSAR